MQAQTLPRLVASTTEPVENYPQLIAQQIALSRSNGPSAFRVRAQLLSAGRSETVLAASQQLTLRLKVYGSGGENTLHAHANEDHIFIILQGRAEFSDDKGVLGVFGANEGVLLPKGSIYCFSVTSEESLVMLRVGTPNEAALGMEGRIDTLGAAFDPGKDAKNQMQPLPIPGRFYG